MRDGSNYMSTFWKTIFFKWKNGNKSKVPFTRIPSTEDDAILQENCTVKPVYNSFESPIEEKSGKMENERELEPMTIKRKICFFLSFNLWIVYFAVFLWILPCVERKCPGKEKWKTNVSNIELTTNIDVIDDVVIFGYQDGNMRDYQTRNMLHGLNSFNGDILWTKPLDSIPLHIYCTRKFSNVYSAACLVSGLSELMMVNAHTGETILNRTIEDDSRNEVAANYLICGLSPAEIKLSRNWKITSNHNQLMVLNVNMESLTLRNFSVPKFCNNLNIRPAILNYNDENHVVFSCSSPEKTEFWSISVKAICNEDAITAAENFSYLFSVNHDFPSNLRKDVMLTDSGEDCIIVSWSNIIICISKKSMTETWRHISPETSTIEKYVFLGYFASKQIELAVIVRENKEYAVYAFRLSDGNMTIYSGIFPNKELQSAYLVSGVEHSRNDMLLVNVKSNNSAELSSLMHGTLESIDILRIYDSEFTSDNTFYAIKFNKSPEVSKIVDVSSLRGEAIIDTQSDVSLLIVKKNGDLSVITYLLRSWTDTSCDS